jgi:hypothetical protein
MAYKSKFTGAKVDELLSAVQKQQENPSSILDSLTEKNILDKLTGQGLIDKINSVSGNIVFKKFVDCQQGAGKTT